MKIADMTWMQVEKYLESDDRCVLPLGSVEQHAYLSLAVDAILSETVAVDAAEPTGVPVFPAVAYGLTPYFMGYPGTVTLTPDTYGRVLREILNSLEHHGFRRIVVVNGHGGNRDGRPAVDEWAGERPHVSLRWHDWWAAPDTMASVRAIDSEASHASWMEGFAWTQVEGVEPPTGHKAAVDLSDREDLSASQLRERLGDGSFGGYYTRPEEDLQRVWSVAVAETRQVIEGNW
ncbi:MAG: creatininase family protein [Longimicrobiales bacterium]|jgi:creatinine amidohydrolase